MASDFCDGSPLMDVDYLWNNTFPRFTDCFINTVLVIAPSAWLWITSPILLAIIFSHNPFRAFVPIGKLNVAKCAFTALLTVISIIEVIHAIQAHIRHGETVIKADVILQIVRALSLLYSIFLLQLVRYRGFVTSGFLFTFWILELITKVIPFYQFIILQSQTNQFLFNLFYVEFTVVFIIAALNCFAETRIDDISTLTREPAPELSASFLSKITISFVIPLMRRGYKKLLHDDDIPDLAPELTSAAIVPQFQRNWKKLYNEYAKGRTTHNDTAPRDSDIKDPANERTPLIATPNVIVQQSSQKSPKKASALHAIIKTYGLDYLGIQFIVVFFIFFMFMQPLILQLLIDFTQNSLPSQQWKGYLFALALFFCAILLSLCVQNIFLYSLRLAVKLRSAIIAIVFRKSLTITSRARNESTVGEIINLMAVDTQRLQQLCMYLWDSTSGPIEIIVALVLLYITMGPSVFAGLAAILLMLPVNVITMVAMGHYQTKQMAEKDKRVKMMSEVLGGIKVLKLYAWEPAFEQKIKAIRQNEISIMKKIYYLNAIGILMWTMTPYLVSLATFATYVYISPDHYLSPNKAFVAISLFNILRFSLNLFPIVITEVVRARVSLNRISHYLCQDDLDPDNVSHSQSEDAVIVIENGKFQWSPDIGVCLNGINLRVSEGQLLAVVGQVGSGKSSLISAILGEMEKLSGRVNVKGKVAYVPQEAWIQNATLRDNILFGVPYNEKRYKKVLQVCALTADLDILPAGDLTEIGEKGINLSGGQKQRVSVARAVYSEADIYLLDDPLSAVDSHVGKHIFEQVLGESGVLRDKTRVLVTHGIHWLPFVDEIVVLATGEISERGSYDQLLENEGAFAQFMQTYQSEHISSGPASSENTIERQISLMRSNSENIGTSSPTRDSMMLDGSTEGTLQSVGRSRRSLARQDSVHSVIKSVESIHDVSKGAPLTTVGDTLIEEENMAIGGVKWSVYSAYFKAMGFFAVSVFIITYAAFQGVTAGGNIWLSLWTDDKMLNNHSLPANSTHRLHLNDFYLGIYGLFGVIEGVLVLIFALGMASRYMVGSQRLHDDMLHTVLRCAMSFFDTTPIGRVLNRFSKDIDTVDEDIPSTIGMFIDSMFVLIGILVVIAYSTPLFLSVVPPVFLLFYLLQTYIVLIHYLQSPTKYLLLLFRWLGVYLDTVGNLTLLLAMLFVVSMRDTMSGGTVGLSISYAIEITGALTWMVRMASDIETNIVAVERIREYTEVPTEAPWTSSRAPPKNWPDHGEVTYKQYTTRYRPGLDLVLKGINIHVSPGEKVGIVGRTGAGKSSMTLSLFRIIEAAGGSIMVDGWNIADMGLHDLRANLTILPQDPVLFSGSLRMNLDPLDAYSDHDIWTALEHAHLKSFVESLPENLEHECGEGGGNLSVGQKQLVCLARSLLRKTKILILDEATAAVDMETDELIQETIKSEFSDCTILTIAHRLNTILDYDRILVLDNGLVSEYDTPEALLTNKEGVFFSMAANAGLVE